MRRPTPRPSYRNAISNREREQQLHESRGESHRVLALALAAVAPGEAVVMSTGGVLSSEDLDASYALSTHTHVAADVTDLGSLATVTPTGTPDGTKFLRDDASWQVP